MFTEDCVFHPTVENYVMIVAFCTIFCLSVIGNSVVVVVILQQRSMRTVTNVYLLNLAVSDLLLSVVCMPPTLVSSLVYCWVFGDLLCKLLAYLQPVVVTASAYTLAAIALERYYAICKPLHSRVWHTRGHAISVIALVWLISIIANFFMLFMYELRTYNRSGLNCGTRFEPIVHFGYQIYMTVVLLVIPLVLMSLLYGSVIQSLRTGIRMDIASIEVADGLESSRTTERGVLPVTENIVSGTQSRTGTISKSKRMRRQRKSVNTENGVNTVLNNNVDYNANNETAPSNGHSPAHKNSVYLNESSRKTSSMIVEQSLRSTHSGRTALAKQRLIRMLIVIVIIFFCCWTPSYVWWLLLNAQDVFGTFNVWNSSINTFITILTYLSTCMNFVTYFFLNSKFRNALFLSFGCSKRNGLRSHFQRVHNGLSSVQDESNFTQSVSKSGNLLTRSRFRSMPLMLSRLKSVVSNDCPITRNRETQAMQDPLMKSSKKTTTCHNESTVRFESRC
ncbi:Cholecystokinin receptor [Aphelenchoides besseyi]|nr:Cholecystokinin receptor [Aphelenchoides besseyi]